MISRTSKNTARRWAMARRSPPRNDGRILGISRHILGSACLHWCTAWASHAYFSVQFGSWLGLRMPTSVHSLGFACLLQCTAWASHAYFSAQLGSQLGLRMPTLLHSLGFACLRWCTSWASHDYIASMRKQWENEGKL